VSKWGTYYPKTYSNWLKLAKEKIALLAAQRTEWAGPWSTPVEVHIVAVIEKAKTSKLTVPIGDVDNYAKAALDVMTHNKVWPDDKLVTKLYAEKRFAEPGEAPRVSVTIHPA
jgi:Holliday junction resolvase RusA-like endonuclease